MILCEDRQQEVFARHFLESCGVDRNKIYPKVCPRGKQAGEQYVRDRYPHEVVSYRRVSHRLSAGLVVITDADAGEVADRIRQLETIMQASGVRPRGPAERIGIFIPRRNIETWIYFLMGQSVDENSIYPKLQLESECIPQVKNLAVHRNQPLEDDAPPSLQAGCLELSRIL